MRPGKDKKVQNEERTENIPIPLTLTEEQHFYYNFELTAAGPLFVKVNLRITAYEYFARNDLVTLNIEICRTNAGNFKRPNFEYHTICYARFAQVDRESHPKLDGVHIN